MIVRRSTIACFLFFTLTGNAASEISHPEQGELIVTSSRQVEYDFDGIEATLSYDAFVDNDYGKSVSLVLKCSREERTIGLSFFGIRDDLRTQKDLVRSIISIGEEGQIAFGKNYTGSRSIYIVANPLKFERVALGIYRNVHRGVRIRVVGVQDESSAVYDVLTRGQFVPNGELPGSSLEVDLSDVKRRIGRFDQTCSRWWRE